MKKLVLLALIFSLSVTTFVSAQAKKTQKEIFQPVYNTSKSIVQSHNYQFVANVIYNNKQREKLDENANQINISKTEVSGQLREFSKDRTIHTIKSANTVYETSFDDEKQVITIIIKSGGYELNIEVKPNGNAFLTLLGYGNTAISYAGKLTNLK